MSAELEQEKRLGRLFEAIRETNPFWRNRFARAGVADGASPVEALARLPLLTKDEVVADQADHPPWGTNLTFPLDRYTRLHQTSGSSGTAPLRWLDTPESWGALLDVWDRVFDAAEVTTTDRFFVAFSFGPFLGFWTAFDAAARRGCLAIPGGGMSSEGRLRAILDTGATVLCATPTYALRLAEVAAEEAIDLSASAVRAVIVAGEPGGSVPSTHRRLSRAWGGARVLDHHGMTEVGPVSYPSRDRPGLLHVDGRAFHAEVLDSDTGRPAQPGEVGELVLTTLLRVGSPLVRYRTGDLVRRSRSAAEELGTDDLALEGGILSRTDDMVVVRGVNLYPSAFDHVVRSVGSIAEYRVEIRTVDEMAELEVLVEPEPGSGQPEDLRRRLEGALKSFFQLRIPVTVAQAGSLPRFELKAKRWIRRGRS